MMLDKYISIFCIVMLFLSHIASMLMLMIRRELVHLKY